MGTLLLTTRVMRYRVELVLSKKAAKGIKKEANEKKLAFLCPVCGATLAPPPS